MPGSPKPTLRRAQIYGATGETELTERQAMVLRALVAAYVGQAGPVASGALSHLMAKPLSSASIRNTLGELHEAGLIDKAHASAGRVPTEAGLQVYVDHLLELGDLGPHQQRLLERQLEGVDARETPRQASQILSQYTRQLGFVVAPRVEHLRLQTIHLVPVAEGRVLAVLVAENGGMIERLIEDAPSLSARELEKVREHLAERIEGRTLIGLRRFLEVERQRLRGEADDLMRRSWTLGLRACEVSNASIEDDLVVATRLALLDQPEFADPGRVRGLFSTLETNQQLLELLRRIAHADTGDRGVGLSMSLGAELGEPSLRDCALVAVSYGTPNWSDENGRGIDNASEAGFEDSTEPDELSALGVLGVIGPRRMDYGRVIPLVHYCSELVTRKLLA